MAVARSSSGGVTKSQGEGSIWEFLPIDNAFCGPYGGMNFATEDRFGLNLLIYREVGQTVELAKASISTTLGRRCLSSSET